MGGGILANPVLSDSDRERDTLFMQYIQNLYGYNPNYLSTIPSYVEAQKRLAPAPAPAQPQGLESLLTNIGVDPSYFNMYTQGRGPTKRELEGGESGGPTVDLGEQYDDIGIPSFLGFTGDLGATTGRTIRVDAPGDDVIRRAETYQDVLNAYRRQKSQEGA